MSLLRQKSFYNVRLFSKRTTKPMIEEEAKELLKSYKQKHEQLYEKGEEF